MTATDRRALATALRCGDRVQIGRDQDGSVTGEGVVERAGGLVIKVRVGRNVIAFYRTGLERAAPRGVSRGLRVIAGCAAVAGRVG